LPDFTADYAFGAYGPNGKRRIVPVAGNAYVGAYSPDGAMNVVYTTANDVSVAGRFHPSGATRVVQATGLETVNSAPNGAVYAYDTTVSPYRAMQPMLSVLQANAVNLVVVGAGDSITATTSTSHYEKWWALLAALYPQYTFQVAKWNDGLSSYDAPVTLTTGLGANTAIFYNASVSGTKASYLLGDKLGPAITNAGSSLILCSYGANHAAPVSGAPYTRLFFDWIGSVRKLRPTTPIIIVSQPPNQSSESQAPRQEGARIAASLSGVAYIPLYEKMLQLGRPVNLYTDSVHTNSAGGDYFANIMLGYCLYLPTATAPATPDIFISRGDLVGSLFDKTPTGWAASNTTMSNTTVAGEFETGGSALKLVTTTPAASNAFVNKTILADATAYRGRYLTLLSRQRGFAGSSLRCGLQNIYTPGPPSLTEVGSIDNNEDLLGTNFYWKSLTMLVPQTATSIVIYFYVSTINESGTLCIDQMYLVPGLVPGTA
jgi:hypothetical protein